MEYIQGFLFTSKYILGRNGNTDIFYLFSAFVLFYYILKRKEKLLLVLKIMIPFAVVTTIMAFAYPWTNVLRTYIFLAKTLLNMTLMVFVACNCKNWKIFRFVETIVWIHAIETVFALLLRNSSLWLAENFADGGEVSMRLQLFYINPGAMAFVSGLVLVMLVYQIMTEEVFWKQSIGAVVMLVDLYLSYGFAGIGCAMLAILSMLGMGYAVKVKRGDESAKRKYKLSVLVAGILTLLVLLLNTTYLSRIKGILNGTDNILRWKLLMPLEKLGNVLTHTHFLGVGFGNGNIDFALDLIGLDVAFPNSFLRILSEGGIFGLLLVLACIIIPGYLCIKYGSNIDRALFIYVTVYQIIGGYFTDPTNFFIYGWIIGDSLNNMVSRTGTCFIGLFIPVKKDKLKIAMIGHKRIPGREGGVEVVVEELSKRFVKMGHQVDAYNRSGSHISGKQFNTVDYSTLKEYEGIGIMTVPTVEHKGIAAFIYALLASLFVVWKDYDVVHYHAEGPAAFMWIPSMFGIKTVSTIHGLDWARSGKWGSIASSFIKFGEKMAVEYSDAIIVLSRHLQQYFRDTYNRDTMLIYNGVNRPVKQDADIIKSKYGLDKDSYILSLSRLTREKKIDLLIECFDRVNTDKKLVIAGGSSDSGEYVKYLQGIAGDTDRIIFTGFVQGKELEELYSNAYVYCLPSELEGMPLSLLEAMSYGNCCLTSDIAECIDVTRDHGLSFRTNDERDFVERLQKLVDNPQLVKSYKDGASDYICDKYNWDDIAAQTEQLYKQL